MGIILVVAGDRDHNSQRQDILSDIIRKSQMGVK